MSRLPFKKHSLLFAPMEGVTDGAYRLAIARAFSEWDYFSTDFFRVPTVGNIYPEALKNHYGKRALLNTSLDKKTSYQILTSARAQTKETVAIINELGFHHLDLNLGCPSKKVNAHHGGAYLLSDIEVLRKIIKEIRETFKGVFTAKIRVGYKDDLNFLNILKMLEDEGVEAITIHARTRDQLYQGIADWKYIKEAVKATNIPIIGNGDIWTVDDVIRIFDECDPYAVMLGRSALKTPWLATLFEQHKNNSHFLSDEFLLEERKHHLDTYFYELEKEFRIDEISEEIILKRFKSFSRYLFDDFPDFETVRGRFLRSEKLSHFKHHLADLIK